MFGSVEETNGVQSWPKSAKPVVRSVSLLSMRAHRGLAEADRRDVAVVPARHLHRFPSVEGAQQLTQQRRLADLRGKSADGDSDGTHLLRSSRRPADLNLTRHTSRARTLYDLLSWKQTLSRARLPSRFRRRVGLRIDGYTMLKDQLAAEPAGDRNQDDAHGGEQDGDGVASANPL
jgi:hypothetical protein